MNKKTLASSGNQPDAKPKIRRFGLKLYLTFVVTTLSVLLNIILLKEKHIPSVTSFPKDGVTWYASNSSKKPLLTEKMAFSGLATGGSGPISASGSGYTWYQGKIILNSLMNDLLECRISRVVVLAEIVAVEPPFQTGERLCKIIDFDEQTKKARLEADGITFSINGDSVMWQTQKEAGALVSVINYIAKINSSF